MGSLKNIFYRIFGCCLPNKYDEYNEFSNNEGVMKRKKLLTRS